MIISRTPFRISFFGGGTDYPEWYARARRRRAGDDDRQVLLHQRPRAAAVLRPPLSRRLFDCREREGDRRDSASGGARRARVAQGRQGASRFTTTATCPPARASARARHSPSGSSTPCTRSTAGTSRRKRSPTRRFTSSSACCASVSGSRIRCRRRSAASITSRSRQNGTYSVDADRAAARAAARAAEPSDARLHRHLADARMTSPRPSSRT